MGLEIIAKCKCGFQEDELSVGVGWYNCGEIAICYKCKVLKSIRIEIFESYNLHRTFKKDELKLCESCMTEYSTFDEKFLINHSFDYDLIFEDDKLDDKEFEEYFFVCPNCKEKKLYFEIAAIWFA